MKTAKIAACILLLAPFALQANTSTDRQIEAAYKASYNYRVAVGPDVKVSVNDGVVTLTGTVSSDEQSRLAEDTAESLPGVASVDNDLKVTGAKEGSDEWIALKIRSRLLVMANVSLANTKISVKDGVVTLTGTADNEAQKELTGVYAKDIDGVRSVNNDIVVNSNDHDSSRHEESMGDKIDDSSITAEVKYQLFSHSSTSALKTNVNTNDGHVVISGDASSDAEKDLVTNLAKNVRGVVSVDNNMTVRD